MALRLGWLSPSQRLYADGHEVRAEPAQDGCYHLPDLAMWRDGGTPWVAGPVVAEPTTESKPVARAVREACDRMRIVPNKLASHAVVPGPVVPAHLVPGGGTLTLRVQVQYHDIGSDGTVTRATRPAVSPSLVIRLAPATTTTPVTPARSTSAPVTPVTPSKPTSAPVAPEKSAPGLSEPARAATGPAASSAGPIPSATGPAVSPTGSAVSPTGPLPGPTRPPADRPSAPSAVPTSAGPVGESATSAGPAAPTGPATSPGTPTGPAASTRPAASTGPTTPAGPAAPTGPTTPAGPAPSAGPARPARSSAAGEGPELDRTGTERPDHDRSVGRPARRSVTDGHHGFVVVDFGTTTSTATLRDNTNYPPLAMYPSQMTALRTALADLLTEGPPVALGPEWRSLLTEVWAEFTPPPPIVPPPPTAPPPTTTPSSTAPPTQFSSPDQVRRLIDDESDAAVHRIMLVLDQRCAGATVGLRGWLAARLYQCYDTAFAVPPLEALNAHRIRFDSGEAEVLSRIDVRGVDPLQVVLGQTTEGVRSLGEAPSVKQHLMNPQPELTVSGKAHADVTLHTDDLIAGALDFLIGQTDTFTTREHDGFDRNKIDDVVVTYPAMATPDVKERLRELVRGLGVQHVCIDYDEAIAAAMFFVIRDIGSDRSAGLGALRARMRQVDQDGLHHEENLLVLDVGGGTVDIALVSVELSERRPRLDGADPAVTGAYYTLKPTLQGTTGAVQRGGDFLTLLVFYWLKATVVDQLLTAPTGTEQPLPDTGSTAPTGGPDEEEPRRSWDSWRSGFIPTLAPGKFRNGTDYLAGSLPDSVVREVTSRRESAIAPLASSVVGAHLDAVLPTRTVDGARGAFQLLWQAAEEAKRTLGTGSDAKVEGATLDRILSVAGDLAKHEFPSLAGGVTLDVATFTELARPVLRETVSLARDLAESRLGGTVTLDRIILTGRGSQLGQLTAELTTTFDEEADRGERLAWSRAGLVLETTYAKHATSVGACLAEIFRRAGRQEHNVLTELAGGRTHVWVDVDNLFRNLPCSFELVRVVGDPYPLASIGTSYEYATGVEPRVLVETDAELAHEIEVRRVVPGSASVQWGTLKFADLREADDALGPAGDDPPRASLRGHDLRVALEIDWRLRVRVHLWTGTAQPLRIVDGGIPLREGQPGEAINGLDAEALARRLYVVVADSIDDSGRPVFGETATLADTFVDADGGRQRAGVFGRQPLPALGAGERWCFSLIQPDGTLRRLCNVAPPDAGASVHYATLDEECTLQVHPLQPAYPRAERLRDVQRVPGAVFTAPLVKPRVGADVDYDDPFGGLH